MPQKSKLDLPPLNLGDETIGQRLARLRKERGFTQNELAKKMGFVQALISEYERDKIRPFADILIRFAIALNVSLDEIVGLKENKEKHLQPNLRLIKRIHKIVKLPKSKQKYILKILDSLIDKAEV
jgi:transcriptional regulator with XRE-family HTH domain